MSMDILSLDTKKLAEIVVNGENFVKKAKNTVNHLQEEFAKLKPESQQSREFHNLFKKEMADIEDKIVKKLDSMMAVTDHFKRELEKLENSDEIFAAARASVKESKATGKVKLTR